MPALAQVHRGRDLDPCDSTPANEGASMAFLAACTFTGATAAGDSAYDGLWAAPATTPSTALVHGPHAAGAHTVARMLATDAEGRPYEGDLFADILEYRALRMRTLQGQAVPDGLLQRLDCFERRLRAPQGEGLRQFRRFGCEQRTTVLVGDGAWLGAVLQDLSAGGARLQIDGAPQLREGASIGLAVDPRSGGEAMVLPSRVVWTRSGAYGLMFAGPPKKVA